MANTSKPAFNRQESWRYKRVKQAWRRARGVTSKIRKEEAGWPPKVKIGYGTASATKGLHPRGLQERLIHQLAELEGLDPKIHIIRISRGVGERKRLSILEELRRLNFHIANPGKQEEKPVAAEEEAPEESGRSKEIRESPDRVEEKEREESSDQEIATESGIDRVVEEDEAK